MEKLPGAKEFFRQFFFSFVLSIFFITFLSGQEPAVDLEHVPGRERVVRVHGGEQGRHDQSQLHLGRRDLGPGRHRDGDEDGALRGRVRLRDLPPPSPLADHLSPSCAKRSQAPSATSGS